MIQISCHRLFFEPQTLKNEISITLKWSQETMVICELNMTY